MAQIRTGLTLAFTLGCLLSTSAYAFDVPEAALSMLNGPGDRQVTDLGGYRYRIFAVADHKELQRLIDVVTGQLLQTPTGQNICRWILGAEAAHLRVHLGISEVAARQAAQGCRQPDPISVPWVYGDPEALPHKISPESEPELRRYLIVVTNRPRIPFESWTDAYSQQTTFILSENDLNLAHLRQLVAHELAIYFDAKSWPWGPAWSRLSPDVRAQIAGDDSGDVAIAALNPAIATVLAYIRAFQLERQLVEELATLEPATGLIPAYGRDEFPFFYPNCRTNCLRDYILAQQQWLQIFYRPLLAFSPHYRVRKLEQISRDRIGGREMEVEVLERAPVAFIQNYKSNLFALDLLIRPLNESEAAAQRLASQILVRNFLPRDLGLLSGAEARLADGSTVGLLSYLAEPLLSNVNLGLATGPRPRVRTGGTQ